MMYRKNRLATAAALLLAAIIVSTGCSNNSSPMHSSTQNVQILERPQGPNSKPAALITSAWITADAGALLEVGDVSIGITTLDIPAGAVDDSTLITMDATTSGPIFVDLGPHGTDFNAGSLPILQISFQGADLSGIDPNTINIYYNNVAESTWDPVEVSVANPTEATVTAPLAHFSQYAPGSEE
jgi:hypothetical protein